MTGRTANERMGINIFDSFGVSSVSWVTSDTRLGIRSRRRWMRAFGRRHDAPVD